MSPGTHYQSNKKCETCGEFLWVVPLWIGGWAFRCKSENDGRHPDMTEYVMAKPQSLCR